MSYTIKCILKEADVAQLAEQLICNQQVAGSSPTVGSRRGKRGEVPKLAKGGRL